MPGDLTPISHARDLLGDQVRLFCNECHSRGITEATPEWWVREFQNWQEFDDAATRYRRDMRDIADAG